MKYKLKVYYIWEFGKRKDAEGNPHQEDSIYPLPGNLKNSSRTFILCDGMGGHDAGEVASATVCETIGSSIFNNGHDDKGIFTDDDLNKAISDAFDALDRKDNGAEKKMGTTMTFLKFHNSGATIAHMGDSRVYHIRPGKDGENTEILFKTEDHSLVNDLIKIGELTPEEARCSKQKNIITRAMQPNMERRSKADIHHITDIKAGDYFYMCSDGMLEQPDMESGESLRNIFSEKIDTTERKVEILTDVTEDNNDNHTAIIIHVEEVTGSDSQQTVEPATVIPHKKTAIVEDKHPVKKNVFSISNTGKSRQIIRFVIIAILVAACIIGIRYVSSCSGKHNNDNTEQPLKDTPYKRKKKTNIKQKSKRQVLSQKPVQSPAQSKPLIQSKPDKQQEETTTNTGNQNAAQTTGNNAPSGHDSHNNAGKSVPKVPSSNEDIVNSDQQTINDGLKK